MSKNSLTEYEQSQFKVAENGSTFVSIRGAASILGIDDKSLGEHFRNSVSISKLGKRLVDAGFKIVTFGKYGVPDTALAVVIEYYATVARKKSPRAKQLLLAFASIGIREWVKSQINMEAKLEQIHADKIKAIHLAIHNTYGEWSSENTRKYFAVSNREYESDGTLWETDGQFSRQIEETPKMAAEREWYQNYNEYENNRLGLMLQTCGYDEFAGKYTLTVQDVSRLDIDLILNKLAVVDELMEEVFEESVDVLGEALDAMSGFGHNRKSIASAEDIGAYRWMSTDNLGLEMMALIDKTAPKLTDGLRGCLALVGAD